jgi:hypothetical protein
MSLQWSLVKEKTSAFTNSQLKKHGGRVCRVCVLQAASPEDYKPGCVYMLTDEEFHRLARNSFSSIRHVFTDSFLENRLTRDVQHRASEELMTWCNQDEIDEFLRDENDFIQRKADELTSYMFQTRCDEFDHINKVTSDEIESLFMCECTQDEGCHCHESNARAFHLLTCFIPMFCNLLNRRNSDKVLLILISSRNDQYDVLSCCICCVLHGLSESGNPSHHAPHTAALLSLIMSMRPTPTYTNFGKRLAGQRSLSQALCLYFSRFGTAIQSISKFSRELAKATQDMLVTILPTAYHFGCRRSHHGEEPYTLILCSIIEVMDSFNLLLLSHRESVDSSATEMDKHRAVLQIKQLFVRTKEKHAWRFHLIESRPVTFGFVALIEVLGWWAFNGVAIVLSREPIVIA